MSDNAIKRQAQRDRLLEAALVHIPFDGWSRRSLLDAASDCGIAAAEARRLFPRAGDDLLAHFESWADRRMIEQVDTEWLAGLRVRDRIAALVRARLEAMTAHREAVRRANSARLLPRNALIAGTSLWRTVDIMWSLAGETARDASYYTRRSLLAALWIATFLYWLDDRSLGQAESWSFLERRIDNVMQFGRLGAQIGSVFRGLDRFDPRTLIRR